jgi:hypothetical protein
MTGPFDRFSPTPAGHFRLEFYGALLWLRERLPDGAERVGFLAPYFAELDASGLEDLPTWDRAVAAWEKAAPEPLPLATLRADAGLDRAGLRPLFVAGLVEEDARFGRIFEAGTGVPGQHRPTEALLSAWDPGADVRAAVERLLELGLLRARDRHAPRSEWPLEVSLPVWDAARGRPAPQLDGWATLRGRDGLTPLEEVIAGDDLRAALDRLPDVLGSGRAGALVVRGPAASGRRTVVGAVARACGSHVLELTEEALDGEPGRVVGPLATLLGALPVLVLEAAPGEAVTVPALRAHGGPLAVVLGSAGAVEGAGVERAVTLTLGVPDRRARRRHWASALPKAGAGLLDALAERRMTGGHIRRAGALAHAEAALAGRRQPTEADVRAACRALRGRLLDTHATPVAPANGWQALSVDDATMRELRLLETRCRHRERLAETLGAWQRPGAAGVRVLLTGPSGTGKTLAARTLAAALGLDLYRLDLAAVVDKYLGETEKNLARIFERVESADAMLLIDEGDALMTGRTAVQTANDRYANLETNYLLQRLETFEGIIVVTTNAPERIDPAFRRRMDVVVDVGAPLAGQRLAIWSTHLPEGHGVDAAELQEVAIRCELTGGQIRNAALHATLLGLEADRRLAFEDLRAAVGREYRKAGEVSALPDPRHA